MMFLGDSFAATSGSRTISRILPRTKSAAVSLASWLEQQIAEGADETEPALLPPRLVLALPLLGRRLERGLLTVVEIDAAHASARRGRAGPHSRP